MTDELVDRVAKIVFDAHHDNPMGAQTKLMLFGNHEITFEQVKAGVDAGCVASIAIAAEYRIARAIVEALPTLRPKLH